MLKGESFLFSTFLLFLLQIVWYGFRKAMWVLDVSCGLCVRVCFWVWEVFAKGSEQILELAKWGSEGEGWLCLTQNLQNDQKCLFIPIKVCDLHGSVSFRHSPIYVLDHMWAWSKIPSRRSVHSDLQWLSHHHDFLAATTSHEQDAQTAKRVFLCWMFASRTEEKIITAFDSSLHALVFI